MSRLREWVLGAPERLDLPGLRRALRRGDAGLRTRAARALALSHAPEAAELLRGLLGDPVPGVRRAAARGLGALGEPRDSERLMQAATHERCETPLLDQLAAASRCGASGEAVASLLRASVGAPLLTVRGWRSPVAALGGSVEARLRLLDSLSEALRGPTDPEDLERLRRHGPAGDGASALERVAARGDPRDLGALLDARRSAGRRGDHRVLHALGLHGDPRALGLLLDQLERMDVDPGRGFAQRRQAAQAVGRIGLPTAARRLLRALETEALEHEGRPGAGLGVQFPVRAQLLWALGEVQAPGAAPILAGYLGNLHGSALGGFHLPAMQALVKLGAPALGPLRRVAQEGPEDAAVNAVGVLAALGGGEALRALTAGRGGRVGEAAEAAMEGPPPA